MLSQKIMALRLFDFQIQNMIDTNLIEITLKKNSHCQLEKCDERKKLKKKTGLFFQNLQLLIFKGKNR